MNNSLPVRQKHYLIHSFYTLLPVLIAFLLTIPSGAQGQHNPVHNFNPLRTAVPTQPGASISYIGSPFCTTSGPVAVVLTGQSGGTFSASPAGLAIDRLTGTITPALSMSGNYIVSYMVPASGGYEAFVATTSVVLNPAPDAMIYYPGSPFTTTSPPVSVMLTGTIGGIFSSSPAGLAIDPITGTIAPQASIPGIYMVSYSVEGPGSCPHFISTTTVTVKLATSVSEFTRDESINLFPNPNSGTFHFGYRPAVAGPVRISVVDMTGRICLDKLISNSAEISEEIRMPGGSKGMYVVRVISETGVKYGKVVVE